MKKKVQKSATQSQEVSEQSLLLQIQSSLEEMGITASRISEIGVDKSKKAIRFGAREQGVVMDFTCYVINDDWLQLHCVVGFNARGKKSASLELINLINPSLIVGTFTIDKDDDLVFHATTHFDSQTIERLPTVLVGMAGSSIAAWYPAFVMLQYGDASVIDAFTRAREAISKREG